MGVFEFIIVLVLISTGGKVLSDLGRRRQPAALPPGSKEELDRLRESMDDMSGRILRLEEERDFYRKLLESPDARGGIPSKSLGGEEIGDASS